MAEVADSALFWGDDETAGSVAEKNLKRFLLTPDSNSWSSILPLLATLNKLLRSRKAMTLVGEDGSRPSLD